MIHISEFIDKLKVIESKNGKQMVMTIQDARDLHADITRVLAALQMLREEHTNQQIEEVIQVQMEGGGFGDDLPKKQI